MAQSDYQVDGIFLATDVIRFVYSVYREHFLLVLKSKKKNCKNIPKETYEWDTRNVRYMSVEKYKYAYGADKSFFDSWCALVG